MNGSVIQVTSWGGKLTRQLDKFTNGKKYVLFYFSSQVCSTPYVVLILQPHTSWVYPDSSPMLSCLMSILALCPLNPPQQLMPHSLQTSALLRKPNFGDPRNFSLVSY